jgi:8-oxo-dGTP diphosphatase
MTKPKVTAGVIEKDGKILIAKRKTGKCIGAKWEFPGGKLEENETLQECLKRELKEELDIEVEVKDYIVSSFFVCNDVEIELLAYKVEFISGNFTLTDHEEIKWVSPSELSTYDFTIPDIPIVEKIIKIYDKN